MNIVENPQLSIPNTEESGRASLYYLRRLPNTSEETGSKNGVISR
jgi:hypothetical protein